MLLDTRSFTCFCILALALTGATALADSEPGETFLSDFPSPNPTTFQAAKRGLEQYRDTRQYKNQWIIEANDKTGTIETNWFPEHKGEVVLKVQIAVWGNSLRVDAWQKVGWLYTTVERTDWSRRTERHIQDAIGQQLADRKQ